MTTVANISKARTGQQSASLRNAMEFMWLALAHYTPTGPGSLATGQSGAFLRDRTLSRVAETTRCASQNARTFIEAACP